MDVSTVPRTAAATEASLVSRARRRAHNPQKRDHAILTVAVGLVDGTVSVDEIEAEAQRIANSAAAPDAETIERLRALLRPTATEAVAA